MALDEDLVLNTIARLSASTQPLDDYDDRPDAHKQYLLPLTALKDRCGTIPAGLCRDDLLHMQYKMTCDKNGVWCLSFYWPPECKWADLHDSPCLCQVCRHHAQGRAARIAEDKTRFAREVKERKERAIVDRNRFIFLGVSLLICVLLRAWVVAILPFLGLLFTCWWHSEFGYTGRLPPRPVTDGRCADIRLPASKGF